MKNYQSPNGSAIVGTYDLVPATARIDGIHDDGTPEYAGESDVWWDDQKTQERDGKILYVDEDAKTWTFDQLTAIPDEEDEE